jgi:hypothetical protein
MKTKEQIEDGLAGFYGTEQYHNHFGRLLMTDGVQWLATNAEAYWLMDIVASILHLPKIRKNSFISIKLVKNKNGSALFTADDGNDNVLYDQDIEYTDFPLDKVTMFMVDVEKFKVLMLPSEY